MYNKKIIILIFVLIIITNYKKINNFILSIPNGYNDNLKKTQNIKEDKKHDVYIKINDSQITVNENLLINKSLYLKYIPVVKGGRKKIGM